MRGVEPGKRIPDHADLLEVGVDAGELFLARELGIDLVAGKGSGEDDEGHGGATGGADGSDGADRDEVVEGCEVAITAHVIPARIVERFTTAPALRGRAIALASSTR